MTIRIKHEGLAVPMSPMFALYIADLLAPSQNEKAVTINFRDPNYSADDGGYHPVEIRLENEGDGWRFCYITDFCYVGSGYNAELAKDLDFDCDAGVLQTLYGNFPIEKAIEVFQIWETNFVYYSMVAKVFNITIVVDS
ncbi:MAG: hypothetical protein ACI9LM_004226 [Alteromonadaceae bacterium]|jgi:hypothetical protein